MKNLLIIGALLLGTCAAGQTVRAGDDGPVYSDERPAPRYYEGRVAEGRYYYLPPPPVYYAPPVVGYYGYPRFYHRHYYPYPYFRGYPYRYAPGVRIGVGF